MSVFFASSMAVASEPNWSSPSVLASLIGTFAALLIAVGNGVMNGVNSRKERRLRYEDEQADMARDAFFKIEPINYVVRPTIYKGTFTKEAMGDGIERCRMVLHNESDRPLRDVRFHQAKHSKITFVVHSNRKGVKQQWRVPGNFEGIERLRCNEKVEIFTEGTDAPDSALVSVEFSLAGPLRWRLSEDGLEKIQPRKNWFKTFFELS